MGKLISPEDCGWPDTLTQALILLKSDKLSNAWVAVKHKSPLGSHELRLSTPLSRPRTGSTETKGVN